MTTNDRVNGQTAEFLQSLARDKAIELNRGHAGLGVSGTPLMDEVAIEAPTSLLSAGLPKMLGMGARVSKKISQEGIELVLDTARRLDDEAIEAASKGTQLLDNADGVPLEKILEDSSGSVTSFMKGRKEGEVLSDEALDALEKGLNRDLITLLRNEDELLAGENAGAKLRVYKDGSATLYLRSNPTRYEILHESQHIEHLRQIGAQRYIELKRTVAGNLELEQFVYDNLRRYHWDGLTPPEIRHAQNYIRWLGGDPW
jgi:hypothetical protein